MAALSDSSEGGGAVCETLLTRCSNVWTRGLFAMAYLTSGLICKANAFVGNQRSRPAHAAGPARRYKTGEQEREKTPTHCHHPDCELVERDRVTRRLCQIARNLARDVVPKHQVTKSGEEHRHHKGEDVGDVDHRVEGGWLGHVAVKGGDDGVTGELCAPVDSPHQYLVWCEPSNS